MPKKFQGENTKATAARTRKTEAKAAEKAKQEKEREDALWGDEEDKLGQRKAQRKNELEQRRQQEMERKQANKQAYEQEMNTLEAKGRPKQQQSAQKVTQAQIEQDRQMQEMQRKETERERMLEQRKIVVQDEAEQLPENVNRLRVEGEVAQTVDEAITALKQKEAGDGLQQDRHPEKRVKAAYTAFEERRLIELKTEKPTLRLSQLKQLVKKEWQKSAENPLNQNIMGVIQQ